MITIERGQARLEGSDELLLNEAALMIGTWKSRMLSKGKGAEETYRMIQLALEAADKYHIEELKSGSRMAAEQTRNAH